MCWEIVFVLSCIWERALLAKYGYYLMDPILNIDIEPQFMEILINCHLFPCGELW